MSRFKLATLTMFALAVSLGATGPATAAGGGGGGRGGGGGGGGGGRGGYGGYGGYGGRGGYGGYGGYGYGRGYGYGGYGFGFGFYPGFGYGYGDFGYGYGYGYYPGYPGYGVPPVAPPLAPAIDPNLPPVPGPVDSAVPAVAASATERSSEPKSGLAYTSTAGAGENTARVRVLLPASAQLWLGGEATSLTGGERIFISPALVPGKAYSYEVKVRWTQNGRPVEQSAKVKVYANKTTTVEFRAPRVSED